MVVAVSSKNFNKTMPGKRWLSLLRVFKIICASGYSDNAFFRINSVFHSIYAASGCLRTICSLVMCKKLEYVLAFLGFPLFLPVS